MCYLKSFLEQCVYVFIYRVGILLSKDNNWRRGNFAFLGSPQNWKWVRMFGGGRVDWGILFFVLLNLLLTFFSYLDNGNDFGQLPSLFSMNKKTFLLVKLPTNKTEIPEVSKTVELSPAYEMGHKRGHTLCWLKHRPRSQDV